MSSLPEELRHVSGLTSLDISHNHFDVLPPVIYRLEALRKLNAENNGIKGEKKHYNLMLEEKCTVELLMYNI